MANSDHLDVLKNGVSAWNHWRKAHPDVVPDLSGEDFKAFLASCKISRLDEIDFRNTNLRGADFKDIKLMGVKFNGADLTKVDFEKSELTSSKFSDNFMHRVVFSDCKLSHVHFFNSQFSDCHFINSRLFRADFTGSIIKNSTFIESDMESVDFENANMEKVDFEGSKMERATLTNADLKECRLRNTILIDAKLNRGTFKKVDFENSSLKGANLVQGDFSGANFTGVWLYGVSNDEWIIQDIQCEHIMQGRDGEKRRPADQNFKPGEFEEIYQALYEIEYFFENGFTPVDVIVMDHVVNTINTMHPEFEIKLDSFHSRGRPRSVFTIRNKQYLSDVTRMIVDKYEREIFELKTIIETQKEFGRYTTQNITFFIIKNEKGDEYTVVNSSSGAVGRGARASGNDIKLKN